MTVDFRARLHQRSLALVMNDFLNMIANDIRDEWGVRVPDICLAVEENPRKTLNHEN